MNSGIPRRRRVSGRRGRVARHSCRRDAAVAVAAEIQLQLGDLLFSRGAVPRVARRPIAARSSTASTRGTLGARGSASFSRRLRVAEFDVARREAENAGRVPSRETPRRIALYGDALWASGLFEEAEDRYRDALGHRSRTRRAAITAWRGPWPPRSRLDEAMDEAQAALRSCRRDDLEIHHTVGTIYERMHRFEEAAGAYFDYVNLLPNKDRSEKADWSRAGDPVSAIVRRARAVRDGSGRRDQALHDRLPPASTTRSSSGRR